MKKATELYDQLIEKGKLDQNWENLLSQVDVFKREKDNKSEIVVSFHRTGGDPKTVYIFFNGSGKYSGSNFTGELIYRELIGFEENFSRNMLIVKSFSARYWRF